MSVDVINPDAAVLTQVQEHWMKIAALLVWKLAPNGVTLTAKEIASFPHDRVLLTYGHRDSFEFKLVSESGAARLAAHDATTHRGTA